MELKFAFTDKDDKPLDTQGWSASYNKSVDTAWAPIHLNGETVALVVVKGDDVGIGQLIGLGSFIVKACNARAEMIEALKYYRLCAEHGVMATATRATSALEAAGVK